MANGVDPLETMPVSRYARAVRWALRLVFGALIVFLYLPIVFMVVFSFDESQTPGLPITGFTLRWYEAMLDNRVLLRALGNSITVAVVVSILGTIIGTMAAFVLVRGRIRFPNATRIAFTLPIMVPGVLIGVSLLIYFARVMDLPLSLGTVIAGQLVVTVPFVVLIVASRLQSFDRFLEWAAADLGASPRQALRHVVLPLIAPAILAGALISVTLSIDEFVITWFTVGAQPTLPTFIYTRVKFGVTPEVNAVATVMLVVTLGTLGLAALALGRRAPIDRPDASAAAGRLMRAAVFKGAGVVQLEDVPQPVVEADDDVVIEVEACGICGSDLQILNVPPGHPADVGVVMGHEFIGRVQAIGAGVAGLTVGQRVTVDPDPKCGVCGPCRAGRPASCEDIAALGIFRDGALASHVKAPAAAVFPISDAPPARVAALIEPLACVVNGVNKANPRPGESAIIFGAGAIGCLFLAMFKAAGAAPVIVVEPQAARAAVAAAVGADAVVHPDELAERRAELLPYGADILVDAVGSQFATTVEHAALGGRIVLFGDERHGAAGDPPVHDHPPIVVRARHVRHGLHVPDRDPARRGRFPPPRPDRDARPPAGSRGRGPRPARSGDATKVVITPGPTPAS